MPIPTNSETEAMAYQLAALRGQPVEEVVSAALRAELARARQTQLPPSSDLTAGQRAKVDRIMALVRAAGPASVTTDPIADLYDDQGLPR